jgi:hypothetical protein
LGLRAEITKPDEDVVRELARDPRNDPTLTDSGQKIMLLTRVKRPSEQPPPIVHNLPPRAPKPAPHPGGTEKRVPPQPRESPPWESVIAPKGLATQKLEALKLVPDVKAVAPKETTYVGEGIEDGQMPTRELDRILSDMAVLLRYGHAAQVRGRLDDLRRNYPEDLLLLRRLSEFHIEHDQHDAALETLFALAGGLFERRNVEGMRQVLEQVLILDPKNGRAERLLGLLEQRSDESPHASGQ